MAPDSAEIKEHAEAEKENKKNLAGNHDLNVTASSGLEKVSPHYNRVMAALKGLDKSKTKSKKGKGKDEAIEAGSTSLLMGD